MPSIQEPRRAPEFVPGKKNQVTAITPAQLFAVNFVGSDGQKSMALVLVFGKDTEDGGSGVFVMADEDEMSRQLKIASETVKRGVRAHLANQAEQTADEVPEAATDGGSIDLGRVEKVSDGPVDVKNLDIG
jgi:hypothetical protein